MMLTELGIVPPDKNENVFMSGFAMFLSFTFFGAIPLVAYCVGIMIMGSDDVNMAFLISAGTSSLD